MKQVGQHQITIVPMHTCPESKREMTLMCGRDLMNWELFYGELVLFMIVVDKFVQKKGER